MATGLAMTSGVDVWLNTPVRPMEASGTSGMKAVMNGVPNLSILDGWWPEACNHGVNGWELETRKIPEMMTRDANSLYDLLENDVLPAWKSSRDRWLSMMRVGYRRRVCVHGATHDSGIPEYLRDIRNVTSQ